MFKMGCSMARKILAIDKSSGGSSSGSGAAGARDKDSKRASKADRQQQNAAQSATNSNNKATSGDELNDFSKLEEDPRIPLNVRQIFKITKSWKAIARTMSKTGTAMFLNLFEQNQDLFYLFDRFQHLKGKELNDSMELKEHAATVMSSLDTSINFLSDYDNFVQFLHSIGKIHRKVPGFRKEYFWKIEQPFLKAVKQTLDERCNEVIEEIYKIAIKLIIETISDGYGEDDDSGSGPAPDRNNSSGGNQNNNNNNSNRNSNRNNPDAGNGAPGNSSSCDNNGMSAGFGSAKTKQNRANCEPAAAAVAFKRQRGERGHNNASEGRKRDWANWLAKVNELICRPPEAEARLEAGGLRASKQEAPLKGASLVLKQLLLVLAAGDLLGVKKAGRADNNKPIDLTTTSNENDDNDNEQPDQPPSQRKPLCPLSRDGDQACSLPSEKELGGGSQRSEPATCQRRRAVDSSQRGCPFQHEANVDQRPTKTNGSPPSQVAAQLPSQQGNFSNGRQIRDDANVNNYDNQTVHLNNNCSGGSETDSCPASRESKYEIDDQSGGKLASFAQPQSCPEMACGPPLSEEMAPSQARGDMASLRAALW